MLPELDYELVVSRRAKQATLRVVPGRGLVVSIPQRFPKAGVPDLVRRNRVWIESALAEQEEKTPLLYRQWPPRKLCLPALGKSLLLNYTHESGAALSPGADFGSPHALGTTLQLDVSACKEDRPAVAQEIAAHLKLVARGFLPPLLASYAHLHGLHYERVSIRGQRTRWGSYSSTGTLTLNYKLLFLSYELVTYVVLHELAHTRHMDHSGAFWQLLSQLDVNARQLDRRLREAGSSVPPWLELAR